MNKAQLLRPVVFLKDTELKWKPPACEQSDCSHASPGVAPMSSYLPGLPEMLLPSQPADSGEKLTNLIASPEKTLEYQPFFNLQVPNGGPFTP